MGIIAPRLYDHLLEMGFITNYHSDSQYHSHSQELDTIRYP